jgi:hypothetical protein
MFGFLPIIDLGYTLCLFCKLEDQSVDQVHPSQMMEKHIPIEIDRFHPLET